MNTKALNLIRNFSYTFISNLISMIVSILIVLILPKVLGVEEYGYFQLFVFYASYVGFLHLGWSDGLYLRYGGLLYKELNYKILNNQFIMLVLSQLMISSIIVTISSVLLEDEDRLFIIRMIAILVIIVNSRYMLIHIFQASNRIREFAKITLLEKIIFIVSVAFFILFDMVDFKFFIISDVIGKLISLIVAIYFCKDIVFHTLKNFHFNISETIQNINAGYKLMFANIAGMLIIGVVRFGVERSWDIATFGKVSLTLSISNFLMIFITAIGIIIFPILKRIEQDKLPEVYNVIRHLLGASLLLILIFYYPIKAGLIYWLPNYKESLIFMALVFPMIVFEGKTALLINTYLKALRKERSMLTVNIISLLFSVLLTVLFTIVLKNLELAILSFLIALAFKSIIAEVLLAKYLKIKVKKDIVLEVSMVSFFIIISWFLDTWTAFVVYTVVYATYFLFKRNELSKSINKIKILARN
jgi:O-antigen/teichoic acid export membrane protein